MRTALVALVILLIALAWFNPGMDAFTVYVEDHSERLLMKETGDTALGRVLAGAGGALAGAFVERVTERRNYLVFSIYTIDLDGDDDRDAWRFLGIGGRFFELQEPEREQERR